MRIIHARVFPMDAPVIEDGYVDMRDGRIAAIGLMADKPRDGSEAVSYTHLDVYKRQVHSHSPENIRTNQ